MGEIDACRHLVPFCFYRKDSGRVVEVQGRGGRRRTTERQSVLRRSFEAWSTRSGIDSATQKYSLFSTRELLSHGERTYETFWRARYLRYAAYLRDFEQHTCRTPRDSPTHVDDHRVGCRPLVQARRALRTLGLATQRLAKNPGMVHRRLAGLRSIPQQRISTDHQAISSRRRSGSPG